MKRQAALNAYRLLQTDKFNPGQLTGHLRILQQVSMESMTMSTDTMPVKLNFDIPFDVVIKGRQTWDDNDMIQAKKASVWYTDASKLENKTGVGFRGARIKLRCPSAKPLLFSELAIDMCTRE